MTCVSWPADPNLDINVPMTFLTQLWDGTHWVTDDNTGLGDDGCDGGLEPGVTAAHTRAG